MPSRIIKESINTSETLAAISPEAERLFWRLVTKADDFGLYYGNPQILASMCFPLGPPKQTTVLNWMKELVKADLIRTYTAEEDGKQYLQITTWSKHQQQRASKSKYPLPVAFDDACDQMKSSDNSGNGNHLQADSPVNENESESDIRETGTGNGAPSAGGGGAVSFDEFWAVYPRRVGKKDAVKVWGQIKPGRDLADQIIAGVDRWKLSEQWTKDEGRFIPYPATFLRGERWNDEVDPGGPGGNGGGGSSQKNYDDDADFLGG